MVGTKSVSEVPHLDVQWTITSTEILFSIICKALLLTWMILIVWMLSVERTTSGYMTIEMDMYMYIYQQWLEESVVRIRLLFLFIWSSLSEWNEGRRKRTSRKINAGHSNIQFDGVMQPKINSTVLLVGKSFSNHRTALINRVFPFSWKLYSSFCRLSPMLSIVTTVRIVPIRSAAYG